MFLSEMKLNAMKELDSDVKPTIEFKDVKAEMASSEGDKELQRKREEVHPQNQAQECEDKFKFRLAIKLQSLREFKTEDGKQIPTTPDHRIQESKKCPPAPRKRKPLPSAKRKASCRQLYLDLSSEVEALFPPALRANLGGKIKKIRP